MWRFKCLLILCLFIAVKAASIPTKDNNIPVKIIYDQHQNVNSVGARKVEENNKPLEVVHPNDQIKQKSPSEQNIEKQKEVAEENIENVSQQAGVLQESLQTSVQPNPCSENIGNVAENLNEKIQLSPAQIKQQNKHIPSNSKDSSSSLKNSDDINSNQQNHHNKQLIDNEFYKHREEAFKDFNKIKEKSFELVEKYQLKAVEEKTWKEINDSLEKYFDPNFRQDPFQLQMLIEMALTQALTNLNTQVMNLIMMLQMAMEMMQQTNRQQEAQQAFDSLKTDVDNFIRFLQDCSKINNNGGRPGNEQVNLENTNGNLPIPQATITPVDNIQQPLPVQNNPVGSNPSQQTATTQNEQSASNISPTSIEVAKNPASKEESCSPNQSQSLPESDKQGISPKEEIMMASD